MARIEDNLEVCKLRKTAFGRIASGALWMGIACVVLVLALGGWIAAFGLMARPEKSDCIIILGCRVYGTVPSPFLVSRIEEGLRLYREGYGEYIIASGGQGSGEDISEAQAMKDYLMRRGVQESRIITEDESTSTFANLQYSKEKMLQHNLETTIVVSNKYHLARASIMAKSLGLNATYSGVFVSEHKRPEILGFLREIPALAYTLLFRLRG